MGWWEGDEEAVAVEQSGECPICRGCGLLAEDGRQEPYRHCTSNPNRCTTCDGVGYLGIDPRAVCPARPGSPLKLAYLVARYAAGLALWHEEDGVDERCNADRC